MIGRPLGAIKTLKVTMFTMTGASSTSARTRAELGWKPEQPGLIADVDHPAYFAS